MDTAKPENGSRIGLSRIISRPAAKAEEMEPSNKTWRKQRKTCRDDFIEKMPQSEKLKVNHGIKEITGRLLQEKGMLPPPSVGAL
jgi:hypothetical protein